MKEEDKKLERPKMPVCQPAGLGWSYGGRIYDNFLDADELFQKDFKTYVDTKYK